MATLLGVFVAGGNQTTIDHLTAEQLRRYRFAFPPLNEQVAIAMHLKNAVHKIDEMVAAGQSAIDLLSERRSALISAAVTGKNDVRGVAQAQSEAA
jgi:type I restriction enzyme S subunit